MDPVAAEPSSAQREIIALFIPSYQGGGAERVAMTLAKHLAQNGKSVDLVVARTHGSLKSEPLPRVNRVHLNAPSEILAGPHWVRYLRKRRPACVISFVHSANLISGLGAWLVPTIPVVVGVHNALRRHSMHQWWFRRWFGFGPERFLYRKAACMVGVSAALSEEIVDVFQVGDAKVSTILNPVEIPAADHSIATEHEAWFRKPVVLGVGRLVAQKNFQLLLRSFARVARQQDIHLVILGEGPEREKLRLLASDLGISDRIFMPGFVSNPQAYMRRAHVFALSSHHEGFGLVLVEALAAGAIIVSTDCPSGPREVLKDGQLGALVPVNDEEAFATALFQALGTSRSHGNTEASERAAWLQQFDITNVTNRYLELIDKLN